MLQFLKNRIQDKLFRNTSWMLLSEATAKISRLLTVVVMAAYLTPVQFGIASLALVCHELMRIFSRAGAGAAVIQCEESDLKATAANASLLQWVMCITLVGLQFGAADFIAGYYQEPKMAPLLKIMAFTYLCYPLVAVKVFMVQRENRMRFFAFANTLNISTDNLSTVVFLMLDFGIASVAYAKVITAFSWVLIFAFARVKSVRPGFDSSIFPKLTVMSLHIFGSESARVLRSQIDILIAAKLLSAEALGLYSFAKNAGVGLSQSIANAFFAGLYPYICEKIRLGFAEQAKRKALIYAGAISTIFVMQSLAAPFYIQLLFDVRWESAGSIVAVLCFTGVSLIFVDTLGLVFRALKQTLSELALILYCVMTTTSALLFFQPETTTELAWTTTLVSFTWLLPVILQLRMKQHFVQQKVTAS
ncbi:oligosaccharide flippase family protein [Teredinibacter purpureus]|uniref:oligosaccharide flippase family protein n=1 Tax=Teredinibacter purpureus TaxID=2731756 RepID=UPI00069879DD|nr:oligosaccharide flippase family protein [Teredinibacter purpureus]